jgi:predicted nucleic acid-binding protein
MTTGIVDTTSIIHLFRKLPNALTWFSTQSNLAVTPITWLEVMRGAPGKSGQATCLRILSQFQIAYLTSEDQDWAMAQMLRFRLSRGVEMNDCLIAALCHRLQIPIYTHNVKDMHKLLPASLVVKPYI